MWYVIRHPETIWNSEHRYQGWKDIPLSSHGKKQQEEILAFISELKDIDLVITSDLERCSDIAEKVALQRNLRLVISRDIRELDFGDWEGKTYDEIKEKDEERQKIWCDDPFRNAPPDGETLNRLIYRTLPFLNQFTAKNSVILTHGGVIGVILNHWFGEDLLNSMPKLGACIKIDFEKGWEQVFMPK